MIIIEVSWFTDKAAPLNRQLAQEMRECTSSACI